MSRFVPLSIPNFEGNERKYVDDAIGQGWVSTGGAYIKKLEDDLASFLNVKKAVACQSGTAGLHLAMIECGIMPGDMVIAPTLTFIAAVNPIKYQYANPIFMDCDDSLCIDPIKLRAFCEQECELVDNKLIYKKTGKTIKAIVVVHVFGNLADMEAIMELADTYKLKVIEDATEALGSRYTEGMFCGKYAGTVGDFGVFSFNGNKIITTGGGGAIVGKNIAEVEHIQYLSTQAKDDALFYEHNEIGYNYRMTNLQAALGVAQLEELPEFIIRKQKNYDLYASLFDNYDYGAMLGFRKGTESNKWLYSLVLNKEKINCGIREIVEKLNETGVQTRLIWGLISNQIPYRNDVKYKIEKAKYYSERIINIPCSTQILEDDIVYVVEKIKNVIGEMAT